MFDGVARPYVMVYGDTFAALPSCGVGGPQRPGGGGGEDPVLYAGYHCLRV